MIPRKSKLLLTKTLMPDFLKKKKKLSCYIKFLIDNHLSYQNFANNKMPTAEEEVCGALLCTIF